MRHADLRREATAVIAKPASAPCMVLPCGTWYGCVGVWVCVWWWDERCDGSKNKCKKFWTEFFDWQIQPKKSTFSTRSPSRKIPFSTNKSDCVRNGSSVPKHFPNFDPTCLSQCDSFLCFFLPMGISVMLSCQ